jgi:hypothetical protein
MNPMRPLVMSIVRLALVVAGLIAVTGSPARAADEYGGCTPTTLSNWACAKGEAFHEGRYCDPGVSGGCESCFYTGNTLETCFDGGNEEHTGWKVQTYGS